MTFLTQLAFIDGIAFDPFFRGLLSVLVGVIVMIGGTYLIVATNTGARQGFLIALAGLFGWMFLMGIIWTIYGIGWKGPDPAWALKEIVVDDPEDIDDGLLFAELPQAGVLYESSSGTDIPEGGIGELPFDHEAVLADLELPDPAAETDPEARAELEATNAAIRESIENAEIINDLDDPDVAQAAALHTAADLDLGEWRYLATSDATRGEAQAAVDAFLVEEEVFATGEFVASQFGAFVIDGKPRLEENANVFERVVHTLDETFLHPTFGDSLILLQARHTVDQPTLPGQPPPVAAADPDAPLVSVIMERDRGGPLPALFSGLRFTPAMFTVVNGLLFALLAWNMHLRDEREAEVRAAAG